MERLELRDSIAVAAMRELMRDIPFDTWSEPARKRVPDAIARQAYVMAEAMMKRREEVGALARKAHMDAHRHDDTRPEITKHHQ